MKSLKLFSIIAIAATMLACTQQDPTTIKFTSANTKQVDVNSTLNFDVTVQVKNGIGSTTFEFTGLPSWVTKTSGTNKVTLTGTAPAQEATYDVTINATNNKVTTTQNFTLRVGAPIPGDGDGTENNPYSVTQVLGFYANNTNGDKKAVWVNGYIVGAPATTLTGGGTTIQGPSDVVFGTTGIRKTSVAIAATADETDWQKVVIVELKDSTGYTVGFNSNVNLVNTPSNLKKPLAVKGNLARYFAVPGVRDITGYKFDVFTTLTMFSSSTVNVPVGTALSFTIGANVTNGVDGTSEITVDNLPSWITLGAVTYTPPAGTSSQGSITAKITGTAPGTTSTNHLHVTVTNNGVSITQELTINVIPLPTGITNGNFEGGFENGMPDGWIFDHPESLTASVVTGGYSGRYLKVNNPTATVKLYQQFVVQSGASYTLSFYYKATHAKFRIWSGFAPTFGSTSGIIWQDGTSSMPAANDELRTNNGYYPVATTWTQKQITFTVPTGQTIMQLEFRYYSVTDSEFGLDEVTIVKN